MRISSVPSGWGWCGARCSSCQLIYEPWWGSALAVEAFFTVLFVPLNVRAEVVASTACSIRLRARVVTTTQGAPKGSRESGSLGHRGHEKRNALSSCPGLVEPPGEETGRARPFRMVRLCFRRTWSWSEVTMGRVVRAATVTAPAIVVLTVARFATGVAVCWHGAAEQTLNAVEPTRNAAEPKWLASSFGRLGGDAWKLLLHAPGASSTLPS